jgi:hypothetical protein
MANKEQRIYIKMSTSEVESLINHLQRSVKEARNHGLNQVYMDLARNVEITVIPTTEERKVVLNDN